MASDSQPSAQIVAAEINATTPRRISSRANSAQVRQDNGPPVVAGSSHANALISAFTEGGETRGLPLFLGASSRPFKRRSPNLFANGALPGS